jgi:hypothetical protein
MYRDFIGILSDNLDEALTHILRSIISECKAEDIARIRIGLSEDIGYTDSEKLSLTTSRSCDDKYGTIYRIDGFFLFRIEGGIDF